jgi:hypothetical protein
MTTAHPGPSHLDAYMDGELDREAALLTEQHLRGCARCQAEVAKHRALSSALQSVALPEGLGEHTWEQLKDRLPAVRPLAAPAPSGGFLRWAPPVAVFSATAMMQAIPIVTLALTALSGLGLFNVRRLVTMWLPVDDLLPSSALHEVVDFVLSWPLGMPPGVDVAALAERWGSDVRMALTWLVPSALAFLASAVLALLYLSWLAACWGDTAQQVQNGV